jgi:DNA-directed RNA polymerase omega subunit
LEVKRSYSWLVSKVGSKYSLVILAAKRAMQLVDNFNAAKSGKLPPYSPPKVDFIGKSSLIIAMEEILSGKLGFIQSPETNLTQKEAKEAQVNVSESMKKSKGKSGEENS